MEMSARRFSVGSDGVIFVCPPEDPANHGRMRMFNADGSEGAMCGNGIRCVGLRTLRGLLGVFVGAVGAIG